MSAPHKIHPFEAAALAALFAIGISLPLVKMLTVGEPDTSAIEKRRLAPWPDYFGNWKWKMKYLPQQIDSWYSDHFGFRAILLEAGSLFNFKWFSVAQQAVIGRDGWLFYKIDPPIFTQSFSEEDLAKWKAYLERRQQWLAARGIKYLFVVPPDKDSVYPEFLPSTARQPPPEMPVDQLVRYLAETHSSVNILSLRGPLLAAKTREREPLFYKQDGHWNTLGAYYGYEAIIQRLSAWFPALNAKPRSDFSLVFTRRKGGDIADLLGLPNFTALKEPLLQPLASEPVTTQIIPFSDSSVQPYATQLKNHDNLPQAVMMCDSFSFSLVAYLSQSFSRITYFWPSFSPPDVEKMMAGTILKEKPDIFIEERVQRFVPFVPDERTVFGGAEKNNPGTKNP